MDPGTAGVVITIVFGVCGFVMKFANRRRERRDLRQALVDCGIEVDWEQTDGFSHRLRGQVAGCKRLTVAISKSGRGHRVLVSGLEVVRGLRFSPEGMGSRLRKSLGGADVDTGDPVFDRVILVNGLPSLALAALDAETRARLLELFGQRTGVETRAELADGRLEVWMTARATETEPRAQRLRDGLKTVLAVARHLSKPRQLARALAANATEDPVPAVRLSNLRALVREYPDDWATYEAKVKGCADRDEEVALAAALYSGDRGRDTLLRLAFEAEGDATAAVAIETLAPSLPAEQLFLLFKGSREKRRTRRTVACIQALAAHPDGAGLSQVEELLIDDLASREDGLAEVAARALGRLGSTEAVLPLQEVAERGDGPVRAAARQAVGEIQSRVRGAAPGQVSLSSGEAGQVSLADDASGRVSIPEKPGG